MGIRKGGWGNSGMSGLGWLLQLAEGVLSVI